jgi:short-subunit dehydrogenase
VALTSGATLLVAVVLAVGAPLAALLAWNRVHGPRPVRAAQRLGLVAVAERQFAVNFHGVVRGTRLVLPAMRARRSGLVVTVASVAAYIAPKGEATYAATKHAVHGWMTSVRLELEGSGVQLCLVMPTVVETELAAGTATGAVPMLSPAEVAAAVAGVIDKPRFETYVPAKVSALVRLLALLPQRGRDAMYGRMVPDQVTGTDRTARVEYEARQLPGA